MTEVPYLGQGQSIYDNSLALEGELPARPCREAFR